METPSASSASDLDKFVTELRSGGPLALARRIVRSLAFRTVLGPQDRRFDRLLANDTACVWRHRFEPATGVVTPFRSGYANAPCPPEARGE